MNHLELICNEFIKVSFDQDWWKKLTLQEQQQYILQHKNTKLKPTAGPQQQKMRRLFSSIPSNWKKTLIYNGVGENSSVEQLSDALRPRELKKSLDDPSTQAIIAFKTGTPITQMQPEFIITKLSYEPDKFNCKKMNDVNGNPIDQSSNDSNVSEIESHWRRGHLQKYNKIDLRMSKIVDNLPDKAYTIFAIKIDPERTKLRQKRNDDSRSDNYRSIENTLIAKAVKPLYDYYSYNLQNSYDQLKDFSVPSFDDMMNADPYARDNNAAKVEKIMNNIKIFRSRLDSLNYHIRSAKREHLPAEGRPYQEANDSEWNKRKIHRFMDEIKKLKQDNDLKDDYDRSIRFKKRLAIEALQQNKFEDTADLLNEINMKDLADKILQLAKMTDKSKVNKIDLADAIKNAEV